MKPALLVLAFGLGGCRRDPIVVTDAAIAPSPPTASGASCTPRSAEKLGFPFIRVCPPGEPGFWINATPLGCSAGEHESIRCPAVTAIVHPARPTPRAIAPAMASLVDGETAARLCYFRMGGHMASRAERTKARDYAGVATVLVTESESAIGRFRFDEIPEWVFEESGSECENGLPAETCHTGWYPARARSSAIAWNAVRECEAQWVEARPSGVAAIGFGESCPSPPLSDAGAGRAALPCALASPALASLGSPSFLFACAGPRAKVHPTTEDVDVAAYRCVVPESALGTFDVPGR